MRYIGNKESALDYINKFIEEKSELSKAKTFFDAFSGTASVGDNFKHKYKIIANDYLYFSYVFSHAKLNSVKEGFEKLGFNPIDYFNESEDLVSDFVTENYSPAGKAGRMYFSEKNAKRIDFFRVTIEKWKKEQRITDKEYYYLLGCLMSSISKVANIAGVYGAYLKKWDPRAIKDIKFIEVESNNNQISYNEVYNSKLEDIIEDIECDILYLDPPYTKNQYSTQYHVLETIAKFDNPELKGITGGRKSNNASDWSRPGKVEILFEHVIANTKAKHVILSYSSDGIMSKEYIDAVLKRHGVEESYDFVRFNYKKYRNHRTNRDNEHFEYLFYMKMKPKEEVSYASPLNYIGGKHNLIDFIKENEPKHYDKFIDLFGGGFNVGINSTCKNVIYNDINFKVKQLIQMFQKEDTFELYKFIMNTIRKYGLSKNNKDSYIKARLDYNHPEPPQRDVRLLYVLILYGFQQQIRFNSKYDFNNPVGESSFNDYIHEKLVSFSRELKNKKVKFYSDDFSEFSSKIDNDTFIYCDPPYLITLGSYNDGKRGFNGWSEEEEKRLHSFLDEVDKKGAKFMLSNVLTHRGKENVLLKKWIKKHNYRIVERVGKTNRSRKEILVLNY